MIVLLDKNLNIVSTTNAYNIQWNRKYYDYGSYEISINKSNFNSNAMYVFNSEEKELGLINKTSFDKDIVSLQGYFYEKKLDDIITYPSYEGMGEVGNICLELFNRYKTEDLLINEVVVDYVGESIRTTSYGKELGTKIQTLLANQLASMKCVYEEGKLNLHFYIGRNLTRSANIDKAIIFSEDLGNIENITYDIDNSNHKTVAVVKCKFNGYDITEEVEGNNFETYGRKELYVDARDLSSSADEEGLRESMRQRGKEKLTEHKLVVNALFDVIPKDYKYHVDYDLGDICEVYIDGKMYELPIIAIYVVQKNNSKTIQLEFGDTILSQLEQVENNKSTVIDNYGNLDGLPTINGDTILGDVEVATPVIIDEQTKALLGGMGGYLKIIYNDDNQPSGFLIKDQLEDSQAKNVILWNNEGIGFSTSGIYGPFNSAWTINGVMNADYIYTGILRDKLGKFELNLDTGELQSESITIINSKVDEKVSKDEISQYLKYEDGVLSIGYSNSIFTMKLSNTELGFYQGENKVAWINNNELKITSAIVTSGIVVGETDNKDKRLSLIYEGTNGWSFM